jgi:putative MATE family efflux protein
MKDLTRGSAAVHLIRLALPIAVGMLVQNLYYLVDLYFVGRLGGEALAGVGAAGNLVFLVMALTHMLGVGTVALAAPAAGNGDRARVRHVFHQSLYIAGSGVVLTLGAGYACAPAYLRTLGADAPTVQAGLSYIYAYLPGLALQFVLASAGATLRATGVTKPAMAVQLLTVLINTLLAPLLITGADNGPGTGMGLGLGVAGAGLASSISIAAGVLLVGRYLRRTDSYLQIDYRLLRPDWPACRRMLAIGFPAGAEFGCIFLLAAVSYHTLSQFGTAAMAGFGVGSRIMQAIFLPGMALAFAVPAIIGQNLGAGRLQGVRETIRQLLWMEGIAMLALAAVCHWHGGSLVGIFTDDGAAASVAASYLRIVSWNFVASGLVFGCSGVFQAFGNAWPGLWSMVARLLAFAVPALCCATLPWFSIRHLWYLSLASGSLQALISLYLLRRLWRLQLAGQPAGHPLSQGKAA